MGLKAAFLDRDDTIIRDVGYLADPEDIELLPGAIEGLRALSQDGYLLILATNQSGVARGFFTIERLSEIHQRLETLLLGQGVALDGVYFCPHLAEGSVAPYDISCECRKPSPGLILRAAEEHGVDLARSVMIGDSERDVESGRRAGCGKNLQIGVDVADLTEAARLMIRGD